MRQDTGIASAPRRKRHGTIAAIAAMLLAAFTGAYAQETTRTGVTVSVPNGYLTVAMDDLSVESTGGPVRWMRFWDGQEWKFNPHWESLSQSWKNLTGSQTADTTGSTLSGSGGTPAPTLASSGGSDDDGCWVWVDEDWSPSVGTTTIGGVPQAGPMSPERTTPFNRLMGEDAQDYAPPVIVSVDYASLCVGVLQATGIRDVEGIRRENELYLGDQGRYAFSNQAILEKRSVRQLPTASATALYAQLATGSISATPVTNAKGYRWIHKEGDWIDYNTQGQVVAYGDRNDNVVWLVRDTGGTVRGVADANGRVLYSLHYTGPLLTEVRDYPISGNSLDLPARSVHYQYDDKNRLSVVTDARGFTTRYDYDGLNHITKVTDPEGHFEQYAYNGDAVSKRTAADDAVTDYVFEYDDTNKQFTSSITGPETAAGRRKEDYTHNRSGKLVRRIVNGRIEEEVRYDTGARAEIHTNARGFTTRIVHNEFDQTVEVGQTDGTTLKHAYSALHLQPTEDTDEAGVKTQYQYDAKGNLTKRIEALGTADQRVTDYEVNSLGQTYRVTRRGRTEANGTVTADAVWQMEYDQQGKLKKTIDPEGNTRLYVYDRAGNLVRYTDGLAHATRFEVDAAGNLTRIVDALSREEAYVYDKANNVVSYTDARGKATQAAYDAMNRRITVTNAVGGIYRFQYNGQGLPVQQTDEDGRTSRAEFDAFLQLTKEIDGLGNVTQYGYAISDGSASGTLGALFEPTDIQYPTFTERHRFDARERLTSQTQLNPNANGTEGLVSSATYEARGHVKTSTDPNGKTTSYAYDNLGQLTELTDSLGNKTSALYDARGNVLQIKDAKGNVNRFEYDRADRVVKEILPLGQTTIYHYDAAGNLDARTDANGNRKTYAYDETDRLREIRQFNSADTLVRTTTLVLDDTGNLTAWTDVDLTRPSGQQTASGTATYDDESRRTAETITYPNPAGGTFSLSYGYTYSSAGYKNALTWPDGTQIDYSYSPHGELQAVTIPGEGTISVDQFKWVAPTRTTLPGGYTEVRTYDGLLNVESAKVTSPTQQTVLEIANRYGKNQELRTSTRTDSVGAGSSTLASTFAYDDEVRLIQATVDRGASGSDTESFTLDAVGNRVAHSPVPGAWDYDANNRLLQKGTGSGATTFEYDAAGNLTRRVDPGNRITVYRYDTQNRLIEVRNGADALIARYGYAPADERLWKEQYRDASGNALAQPLRTYYLYSDEGLIAEAVQPITLNGDGSVTALAVPQITTQYGPRPDSDVGTDVLFVKARNSNGQPVVAYYHNDQIGTPLQATDKQGNLVWAAYYNVFGAATIITPDPTPGAPTIESNLRLPGQYADSETGLLYNTRRYYDPTLGRYISQDPIGLAGGDNRYRYADADPVNLSDPTGECPACVAYVGCLAACGLESVAENLITGECNNFGEIAGNCALGCAVGLGFGKLLQWGKKLWDRLPCAVNSFASDTLVQARPGDAGDADAVYGKAQGRLISEIKVGDEVLALREWEGQGSDPDGDERLSYQKVTNVYSSYKDQAVVRLTLDDGSELIPTDTHPFMTAEGWRDAAVLRAGDKLLLKRPGSGERWLTIVEARPDRVSMLVFNLEVANGHTYFVGEEGALVHNGCLRRPYIRKWVRDIVDKLAKRDKKGRILDPNTGKPIKGKPDLGHKPGNEHWREAQKAEKEGLTQKEFNDRMNDPSKYHLEDPSSNRSHRHEQK